MAPGNCTRFTADLNNNDYVLEITYTGCVLNKTPRGECSWLNGFLCTSALMKDEGESFFFVVFFLVLIRRAGKKSRAAPGASYNRWPPISRPLKKRIKKYLSDFISCSSA